MFLSVRRPVFLCLVLLLVALPGLAAPTAQVHIEPVPPVENVPFRVIVMGYLSDQIALELLAPTLEGNVLRMVLVTEPAALFPPSLVAIPYTLSTKVEPLAAGQYTLEVVARSLEGGEDIELASRPLSVGDPFFLTGVPDRVFINGDEPLIATLEGMASCPEWVGDPIVEGDRIQLLLSDACPLLPPTPGPFSLSVEIPIPRAPGPYEIEARRADTLELLAKEDLVILTKPTFLRDRFVVQADFGHDGGDSLTRDATLARLPSNDSALYYFFDPSNLELLVKVLDACDINGHNWVFLAAATDLAYGVEVFDLDLDYRWSYFRPAGSPAPAVTDVMALPCE